MKANKNTRFVPFIIYPPIESKILIPHIYYAQRINDAIDYVTSYSVGKRVEIKKINERRAVVKDVIRDGINVLIDELKTASLMERSYDWDIIQEEKYARV